MARFPIQGSGGGVTPPPPPSVPGVNTLETAWLLEEFKDVNMTGNWYRVDEYITVDGDDIINLRVPNNLSINMILQAKIIWSGRLTAEDSMSAQLAGIATATYNALGFLMESGGITVDPVESSGGSQWSFEVDMSSTLNNYAELLLTGLQQTGGITGRIHATAPGAGVFHGGVWNTTNITNFPGIDLLAGGEEFAIGSKAVLYLLTVGDVGFV